jgi:tetratricopeptide (TPR) repeat protein
MPFRPNNNDSLSIDGVPYRIAEHPAAPGMPYGQTGRRATVYQLRGAASTLGALKVFTPAFRTPRTIEGTQRLAPFATLPGLQAATRSVLTPTTHAALLTEHPDLTYAVLMPWVSGETWQEIVLDRRPLSVALCRALAEDLARVLATMERQSLAHCDLSGPSLLVTTSPPQMALVDLEDLFAPGLLQPEKLPGGSPGYAHRTAPAGLWSAQADRFAGAVLLAEILGWCDERVRAAAADESFFDPEEVQQPSARFTLLAEVLRTRWGAGLAEAFQEVWQSPTLAACPPLAGWAELLAVQAAALGTVAARSPQERLTLATVERGEAMPEMGRIEAALQEFAEAHKLAPALGATPYARALLNQGTTREAAGELAAALESYEQAIQIAPPGPLRDEIALIIPEVKARLSTPTTTCPSCRQPVQPEWLRCPYCEATLGKQVPIQTPPAPFPLSADQPRRRIPVVVIVLLLLLISGGVSLFVLRGTAAPAAIASLASITPLPPTSTSLPSVTSAPAVFQQASATPSPLVTYMPTATPTRTAMLVPSADAIISVESLNMRSGPGTAYWTFAKWGRACQRW